jgi:hypothetical protein
VACSRVTFTFTFITSANTLRLCLNTNHIKLHSEVIAGLFPDPYTTQIQWSMFSFGLISGVWRTTHPKTYHIQNTAKVWSQGQIHCVNRTNFLMLDLMVLTYSKEQSPSLEANRFAARQEIPRILWNPNVQCHIHKSPPPVSHLSQLKPVHTPTSNFLKICLNIIFLQTWRYLQQPPGFERLKYPIWPKPIVMNYYSSN